MPLEKVITRDTDQCLFHLCKRVICGRGFEYEVFKKLTSNEIKSCCQEVLLRVRSVSGTQDEFCLDTYPNLHITCASAYEQRSPLSEQQCRELCVRLLARTCQYERTGFCKIFVFLTYSESSRNRCKSSLHQVAFPLFASLTFLPFSLRRERTSSSVCYRNISGIARILCCKNDLKY